MIKILRLILFIKITLQEKYEYDILFEKTITTGISNGTFNIPENLTSWNLSLWIRVGTIILSDSFLITVNNSNNLKQFLKIKTNEEVYFNDIFIFKHKFDINDNDSSDLKTNSTKWFFFSLNYNFKKFSLFINDIFNEIDVDFEYLFGNNAEITFQSEDLSKIIGLNNVHFFYQSIPNFSIEEIKYYPKKLVALYKFGEFKENKKLIINSVNFKRFRDVKITNDNQIPFQKNNAFFKAKVNFPFVNQSIAFKNFIFTIKGRIIFRNFIQDNNTYENLFWIIN